MSLAFLAPALLAGLALASLPWWIHRVRRPQRKPVPFSSLMFIPPAPRETVRRKRIQHPWLMAIRIAMLALAALAFARPYIEVPEASAAREDASAKARRIAILLDISHSMAAGGAFEEARRRALDIVDSARPGDRIGVMVFGAEPRWAAPLPGDFGDQAGAALGDFRPAARSAIAEARLSPQGTNYEKALRAAEEALLDRPAGQMAAAPRERSEAARIALISDFRRPGLPAIDSRWRLAASIALDCIAVGPEAPPNASLEGVAIRPSAGSELRVVARAKNWFAGEPAALALRLMGEEGELARQAAELAPRTARAFSFAIPLPETGDFHGWIEIDEPGDWSADNRRYVSWLAPQARRTLLIADPPGEAKWPGSWFIERALPRDGPPPLLVETAAMEEALRTLRSANPPDLVAACDFTGLDRAGAETLAGFIRAGGGLLLALGPAAPAAALNEGLLESLGLRLEGPRFAETDPRRFVMLDWIDFDHPVFFPFRSAQYNDFSPLRFFNCARMTIAGENDSGGPMALARFEPDEAGIETAAIAAASLGEGRAMIWAFGAGLDSSNLPTSPRFVPLLQETIAWLAGPGIEPREWIVGQMPQAPGSIGERTARAAGAAKEPPPASRARWERIEAPGEAERPIAASGLPRLGQPGLLRWHGPDMRLIEPVNVDPKESNPERIGEMEFKRRLQAAPFAPPKPDGGDIALGAAPEAGFAVKIEFGRWALAVFAALFLLECLVAARLSRALDQPDSAPGADGGGR